MATTSKNKIVKWQLPELHKSQLEVAKSKKRFKIVVAGRRFGKTKLGTALCILTALDGKRAWWVAPTYAMALEGLSLIHI